MVKEKTFCAHILLSCFASSSIALFSCVSEHSEVIVSSHDGIGHELKLACWRTRL